MMHPLFKPKFGVTYTMTARQLRLFEANVDKNGPNGCWIWNGSRMQTGYGTVNYKGAPTVLAHRIAKMHFHGAEFRHTGKHYGETCNHICDNPPCVNPDHLYVGTQDQNIADRCMRSRTAIGLRNGKSILTPDQVRWIRRQLELGELQHKEMAEILGLNTTSAIKSIKNGQTWRHII